MVEDSMEWMDRFYDPKISQLYDLDSKAAMNHETLASTWYAVGLLARNGDGDASRAEDVIRYVIKDQHDNPKDLWYGDYTREPEEPTVGTAWYPARMYGSWDPNWRGFVGAHPRVPPSSGRGSIARPRSSTPHQLPAPSAAPSI